MNTDQLEREREEGAPICWLFRITVTEVLERMVCSIIYEQQQKIDERFDVVGVNAARMAVSNVSLRFSCVNAEHSI